MNNLTTHDVENLHPGFADASLIRDTAQAALLAHFMDSPGTQVMERHLKLLELLYQRFHSERQPDIAQEAMHAGVVALLIMGAKSIKAQGQDKYAREMLLQVLEYDDHNAIAPTTSTLARRLLQELGGRLPHQIPSMQVLREPVQGSEFRRYNHLHKPIRLAAMPDIAQLEAALLDEFPWFQSVTEAIVRELRMAQHFGRAAFRMRPILLAGSAGTGKSRFARRLAELVEVPHMTISCAGSTDSLSLRGTSRGWSSARPGSIIELIHRSGIPNPLVCLDELEKCATSTNNGRIWDVLLQLLERETSDRYFDECLEVACDLSWVSFIGTVNALGPLPEPLRQRFLILHAPAPRREHFQPLVDGIIADIAQEYEIGDVRLLPAIAHEERQALLEGCGINPRLLTRAIHRLLEHKIQTSAPTLN